MAKPHLFLIGYRGSGKSTIGKRLASRLGWDYLDTDEIIEREADKSIREIFESEGEQGFRDREQQVVVSTAGSLRASVISLGGGAILRDANRQAIQLSGRAIWLRAKPETLFARIQGDSTTAQRRPNLSSTGGLAEVTEILARREPVYRQLADFVVETDGRDADTICHDVLRWLEAQYTS